MADNPLRQLNSCGQSVWNDFIRRTFITGGELKKLVNEDGISGVTSNPTIFEKAIGGSSDYDDELKQLVEQGRDAEKIFQQLASTDVRMAADVLRPVYDRSNQHDGFVSIEVSPEAAHDTQKTLEDAHLLKDLVDRPNVMIKVPATPEGIPAIEQLTAEGFNINITLIFAVEVYEEVMDAFIKGLEQRVERGDAIDHIASVASFFVSRVDTLVDKLLEDKAKTADESLARQLKALEGKAAIANAKIAYERFQQVFTSDRFKKLADRGAQVQRPLWASTSTKNPSYSDTMYVTGLVGEETVNTMPPQTIVATRDHGKIECGAVTRDVADAHDLIKRLGGVGIDMTAVTSQLTKEGVQSFADSLNKLFETINKEMGVILAGEIGRDNATLDGQQSAVDATFKQMADDGFLGKLWNKEPALWKPNPRDQTEITDRLGWLHVSDSMFEQRAKFTDIAQYVRDQGFTHAVVLGMGGSSLAPYVLSQSFGRQDGYPEALVLDSTDPEAIARVESRIDPTKTLFVVSSKSGSTTETLSHFKTFWNLARERVGHDPGNQFVAITDPGTSLEKLATEHGFHQCYLNPSDIGGRYSALSYFGLIPAAIAGIDVEKLLDRAIRMEHACASSVPVEQNPGSWLGAIMGDLAKNGQNKVTFFVSPGIATLGLWLEQLLAESTGKEGKGLVPVPDNDPGDPRVYGDDRLFVSIRLDSDDSVDLDTKVDALEQAGRPVVRLRMEDLYDLGAEFFRWEFATAVAGALLGINAFDQPNVQESKDNTKRVLAQYVESGSLPESAPLAESQGIQLYANGAARALLGASGSDLVSSLRSFFSKVQTPDYVAIMAYVAPSPEHDKLLNPVRNHLRDALRVATTLGYGPRFLHSTGQLHKGGPPEGIFLQITATAASDIDIPGEKYSYQTLIRAQALGDFQSLEQHGRPAIRLHVGSEDETTLRRVVDAIREATPSHASVST